MRTEKQRLIDTLVWEASTLSTEALRSLVAEAVLTAAKERAARSERETLVDVTESEAA